MTRLILKSTDFDQKSHGLSITRLIYFSPLSYSKIPRPFNFHAIKTSLLLKRWKHRTRSFSIFKPVLKPFFPLCVARCFGQRSTKGEKNGDYKLQRSLTIGSPRSQKWKGNWFFIADWITAFPRNPGVVGFTK